MTASIPHRLREARPEDVEMILDSFAESQWDCAAPATRKAWPWKQDVPALHPHVEERYGAVARSLTGQPTTVSALHALVRHAWMAQHRPVLAEALRSATVRVACWPEDEWQILGWAASTPTALVYAYVKRPYRRQGLGRALWIDAGSPPVVTFPGRATDVIMARVAG